jgi:hypothetical protein
MRLLLMISVVLLFSCEENKRAGFTKDETTLVVASPSIISDQKDIIRVVHLKPSGQWNFFADESTTVGTTDSLSTINFSGLIKEVPLGQLVQLDSTIIDLDKMREGYVATRKFKGDPWLIVKDNSE